MGESDNEGLSGDVEAEGDFTNNVTIVAFEDQVPCKFPGISSRAWSYNLDINLREEAVTSQYDKAVTLSRETRPRTVCRNIIKGAKMVNPDLVLKPGAEEELKNSLGDFNAMISFAQAYPAETTHLFNSITPLAFAFVNDLSEVKFFKKAPYLLPPPQHQLWPPLAPVGQYLRYGPSTRGRSKGTEG
ncbi:uncharacterized protein BDZ99DRAFT_481215 [Mytilinidion resinicola]|uniref:Uncharacterized protein n=1 Tax=Mytilinidion resinicola TaxID=574789 RepID=A0A6A6Y6E2_9PEZI|nr:uncharacterized protein BDZ99DRAFT_481215 [Mytilinidion resinicola]KAF2804391.1 hypothetical protein BDZ99DRAFT_481215 [Mytilinidion resinicola]